MKAEGIKDISRHADVRNTPSTKHWFESQHVNKRLSKGTVSALAISSSATLTALQSKSTIITKYDGGGREKKMELHSKTW